jgi:hypothetical protein
LEYFNSIYLEKLNNFAIIDLEDHRFIRKLLEKIADIFHIFFYLIFLIWWENQNFLIQCLIFGREIYKIENSINV